MRAGSSFAMDVFGNRYFKITKFIMSLNGQWPYERSWSKLFKKIFIYLYVSSWVITQLCHFLTTKFSNDLVIEVFTPVLTCSICYVKFINCSCNSNSLLKLLESVRHDWAVLTNPEEIKLLKRYAEEGRTLIIVYIFIVYAGAALYAALIFSPCVLDAIMPLEESRSRLFIYSGEYLVDRRKYYVPIALHTIISVIMGVNMTAASDIVIISILFHLCARFSILGYRLEHIVDDHVDRKQRVYSIHRKSILSQRIINCVQFHSENIEYVKTLISHYSVSLVIQAGLTLGVITCTMLRMFETLKTLDDLVEAISCTLHAAGNVLLVYVNIYSGQRLLDCSSDIFYKTYFARWYEAPLETQKSILIILQKTIEPCGILVASFINMSMEVFSSIIRLSVSYFTVLYSVRQ